MKLQLRDQLSFNIHTVNLIIVLSLVPLFDAGFDNEIIYYMVLLTSVSYLFSIIKDKLTNILRISDPLFWLIIFISWGGISYIWSVHYVRTLVEFLQLFLFLMVFIFSTMLDKENKYKVNTIVLLIGSGIAFLGILEFLMIKSSRIVSTFINPNPFGTYLMMLFLFAWGLALRDKRLLLKFVSIIFLTALFLTGSRGAFLATGVALPFLFIGLKDKNLIRSMIETILCISIGLLITNLIMDLAPYVQENLGLNLDLLNSLIRKDTFIASSLVGRLEFWKVAMRVFKSKLITGYGLGTFLTTYFIGYGQNQWYSRFVHNHYLQIAAELGIIGLLIFILFIFFTFVKIRATMKSNNYESFFPGAFAGCLGFLIHIGADFSFNFPGVTVIFFYFIGLLVGNAKPIRNLENQKFKIKLNYRISTIFVMLVIAINLWHFSAIKAYSYGIDLASEGKLEESNRVFKLTNTVYPINSVGFSLEADNYYKYYMDTNNIDYLKKSISLLEKSVKLSPFDGVFHNKLGKLYIMKGDILRAEEELIFGIEYGVYSVNSYIDLGKFYMEQKRFKEAIIIFNEGLIVKNYNTKGAVELDTFESCYIHKLLYDIYKLENNSNLMGVQIKSIKGLTEEYPVLREYFLNSILNN